MSAFPQGYFGHFGPRAARSPQGFRCRQPILKLLDFSASDLKGTVPDFTPKASFAQLIKVYRAKPEGERRYSPAEVVSTEAVPIIGNPNPKRICTSHIERQNLTIRMGMRRLTRLTNGFSKKWDNLWAAYCLHFAYYNFCRIHKTLRMTPAMESKITDHVWDLAELIA